MDYSRLLRWEVTNFMCISYGVCEFDERNIINLKGYNDSGKSAMMRALEVLLFNSYVKDQAQFIQDDKEYFRVVAHFSDGISILRDKYINGQSLYEMYKDSECIFSTKVGGSLQKVAQVPEPIEKYLGVVDYLNSRSCFQKQFLVQTTGSENYKACYEVLHSEEILSAGEMINNDKNKLLADINSVDSQLQVYKQEIVEGGRLTEELVFAMENLDECIDVVEGKSKIMSSIQEMILTRNNMLIHPSLEPVDRQKYELVDGIRNLVSERDAIVITPQLDGVDTSRMFELYNLLSMVSEYNEIQEYPMLDAVDFNRLSLLMSLKEMVSSEIEVQPLLQGVSVDRLSILLDLKDKISQYPDITKLDNEIEIIEKEMYSYLAELGEGVGVCPNCGTIIEAGGVTA